MNTNLFAIIARLTTVLTTNWTIEPQGWYNDGWINPRTGVSIKPIPEAFKLRVLGEVAETTYVQFVFEGRAYRQEVSSRVVATGAKWVWDEIIHKETSPNWTNHISVGNLTNQVSSATWYFIPSGRTN